MSGTSKPTITNLESEITPKIISSITSGQTKASGLFDNTTPDEWNTPTVCYWYDSKCFVELLIPNKCNIWRCGTTNWKNSNAKLKILKYNGASYDDVTTQYSQVTTAITNTQWEKTITNLDPGQYKFVGTGYRIDSEWYIENSNRYLIKQNSDYYSIKEDFYSEESDSYDKHIISELSIDSFKSYGITSLSSIHDKALNKLIDNKYNIAMLK